MASKVKKSRKIIVKKEKKSKKSSKRSKRSLASATRGWKKMNPKNISTRREMMSKCGRKCFLMPDELKFPICSKSGSCKLNCRGVVSAKVRAGQWKYKSVMKKADVLIKKFKCTKASRKMSKKSSKSCKMCQA